MSRRLFLALPLEERERDEVERALREELPPEGRSGRLTPRANWHVTLVFLGPTPPERHEALLGRLSGLRLEAMPPLRLDVFGAFPSARRAEVLWLGSSEPPSPALLHNVERLRDLAEELGFAVERRPFIPHLTYSRVKPSRRILLPARPIAAPVALSAREISLLESSPAPRGVAYRTALQVPVG